MNFHHDKKGESPTIRGLHNNILKRHKRHWDQGREVHVSEEELKEMRRVSTKAGLFKDPRSLLFYEHGWKKVGVRAYGIFRWGPFVAGSLFRKKKILTGMRIWERYNRILVRIAKEEHIPLMEFDEHFPGQFASLAEHLRLKPEITIYDPSVLRANPEDFKESASQKDLYEELRSLKWH